MSSTNKESLSSQPLVEHLRELRVRVIYSFIGIALISILMWIIKEDLFYYAKQPIEPFLKQTDGKLIFTSPMENFLSYIKIVVLASIVVSCPFWLYHLWRFIAPGLYKSERRYLIGFIIIGSLLFFTGVSFVYLVVYPLAFKFLLSFGGEQTAAMISMKDYFNFFFKTSLIFGAAFELPLILTLLGVAKVVTADFLAKKRKYAFLILCVLSALVTPPDPMSMMMMATPLLFLYEISIWSIRLLVKKDSVN